MAAFLRKARGAALVAFVIALCPWLALADTPDPALITRLASAVRGALTATQGHWTAAEVELDAGPLSRLETVRVGTEAMPFAVVNRSGAAVDPPARGYVADASGLRADAQAIARWWHEGGARDRMKEAAPGPVFEAADEAIEGWTDFRLDEAISLVQKRLDRFEVKYGPGSPRLNIVEVGLNAWLQGTPWFRPSQKGVSPNEVLVGYSTSWVTIHDDEAMPASTLEAGWRRYNLDWREGATGLAALLKPRYVSVGVAFAEQRDGALRWPLRGAADRTTRVGPFVSLGDLKVAWLVGPHASVLVSRQFQLLPGLF